MIIQRFGSMGNKHFVPTTSMLSTMTTMMMRNTRLNMKIKNLQFHDTFVYYSTKIGREHAVTATKTSSTISSSSSTSSEIKTNTENTNSTSKGWLTKNPFTKAWSTMRTYQNGVKTIFQNAMKVKELKEKISNFEQEESSDGKQTKYDLKRHEFLLMRQTKQDVEKAVPFVLLAMFLPEAIPFVIIKVPTMIPWTCWTEDQKRTRREKSVEERKLLLTDLFIKNDKLEKSDIAKLLDDQHVKRIAESYSDSFDIPKEKSTLSILNQFMGLSRFGSQTKQENRLKEHMEFLRKDDEFIVKENAMESMTEEEIVECCENRGISTVPLTPEERKEALRNWINLSTWESLDTKQKMNDGLLVFTLLARWASKAEIL